MEDQMSVHNITTITTAYEFYCKGLEERLGKSLDDLTLAEAVKLIGEEGNNIDESDIKFAICGMMLIFQFINKFGADELEAAATAAKDQ